MQQLNLVDLASFRNGPPHGFLRPRPSRQSGLLDRRSAVRWSLTRYAGIALELDGKIWMEDSLAGSTCECPAS